MDYIKEQITEWLKEILVDGILSNLAGLFDNVNQEVGNITAQASPAIIASKSTDKDFRNKSVSAIV